MNNYKKVKTLFVAILVVLMVVSFAVLRIKQLKNSQTNNQLGQNVSSSTDINLEKLTGGDAKIKKFNNYDEVRAFLEVNLGSSGSDIMYKSVDGRGAGMAETAVAPSVAPTMADSAVSNETGSVGVKTSDYSQTNVQVAGVDEADIIKTDGQYIYAVAANDLFIIKATPGAQAEVVSKIQFKSRPQDIYISGDRLTIFGADDQIYTTKAYTTFRRQNSYTFFKVFDISDKKSPKQVRDLSFEGYYFDSRMIGDYVYFVTNNYSYYLTADSVLPRVMDGGAVLENKCGGDIVKCYTPDVFYFNIPYNTYNFTSVNAINIKDTAEAVSGNIYLTDAGQTMYVSPENIYITYTKYISEYDLEMDVAREIIYPQLSVTDQNLITKIETTDETVLSKIEKRTKIQQVLQRYLDRLAQVDLENYSKDLEARMKQKYQDLSKELEKTVIYRIAIDKNKLEYQASGEVTGTVLNQFSMDESGDYFRIATTRNQTWSRFESQNRESYNNLYVLNKNLQTTGRLEDLATGERIYSVRFMGNRAYLVTFKQTDPLFTIDLSNPAEPKVLGQLKVPGFSTYLHPYDENTLIGFGKDAEDLGEGGVKTKGLKLALFDVKDISNPKVLDTYLMGDMGSDSIALYDHKAFLFSKEKNILVLPVTLREATGTNSWGDLTFSGAMAWQINDGRFSLLGRIDHSDGGRVAPSDFWGGYDYYDNTVKRSLYIGSELYTFSNQYLKVNNLSDLKEIKNLELKKEKQTDFEIIN